MKIDEKKLSLAMADAGMTLKDVCTCSGISDTAFRAIRQGKAKPRPATVGRIAKALNVDVKEIICND